MVVKLASGRHPMSVVKQLADQTFERVGDEHDLGLDLLGIRPRLAVGLGRAAALGAESLRRAREQFERMLAGAMAEEDTLLAVIVPAFLVTQVWNADLVTPEAAMRYAQTSLERAEVAGNTIGSLYGSWALGTALLRTGEIDAAVDALDEARGIAERANVLGLMPLVLAALAEALAQRGDERAREAIGRAQEMRQTAWESAWIDTRVSRVLRMLDSAKAADAIERALDNGDRLMKQAESFGLAPVLLTERAELAGLRGDAPERQRYLRLAIDEYERLEAPDTAAGLRSLLESS